MRDIIILAFSAILIENVVLQQFLGTCPFLGVSKKRSNAIGMGIAVVFVIFLSSIVTYGLYHLVLVKLEMTYMRTIVFILVIASLVQIVEIILKKVLPSLYKALGIYLPLITTNCAVLGVALLNIKKDYNFGEMAVYSLGAGLGFLLVMYIFSVIREALDTRDVPKAFKGIPIALIVAAILAIIFSRFSGITPPAKEEVSNTNELVETIPVDYPSIDLTDYL